MKKFWKVTKRILIVFVLLVFSLIGTTAIFISCAPQFGEKPSGAHLERIKQSKNYGEEEFVNVEKTKMNTGDDGFFKMMRKWMTAKGTVPIDSIPVILTNDTFSFKEDHITWYGHSAVLLEIDDKKVLIDPMLGNHASPFSWMGKRFKNTQKPFDIDSIGPVDIVIISHDHYDHLDYESIVKLKDKTTKFVLPLGVSSHLKRWKVDTNKLVELDWWQSFNYKGLQLTATPARHFSGRSLTDRNATLWAAWAIKGKQNNVFFSGDGGYGKHFKEIGLKLGPFDFAMMECGQYNEAWAQIHCMPEQSVQASLDIKGKKMMPIHWGAFDLSIHTWKEPIERALKAADSLKVNLITPNVGRRFALSSNEKTKWWEHIK